MTTKRITGELLAPTLAQRLASMSVTELMIAARGLAHDPNRDELCTAVLDALERRAPGAAFDAFVASLYEVA